MMFGLPEKQMVLLQMAVLMFALPQPYCFNFIEASFSGSLFHHFFPTLPLIAAEEPLMNITS